MGKMPNSYRIMSFDGGGVYGLASAMALKNTARHNPTLLSKIDLFAGSSTGALIALGLASGYDIQTVIDMYRFRAREIFKKPRLLSRLFCAKYHERNLKSVIADMWEENITLGDLDKQVFIPVFNLLNQPIWTTRFFHNIKEYRDDNPHLDTKIRDLAYWTCSAPTFFPSLDGYTDGGVNVNNPSLCALAKIDPINAHRGPETELKNIKILNLGTAVMRTHLNKSKKRDWGFIHWSTRMLDLFMAGAGNLVEYQCKKLLGDNYYRFVVSIDPRKGKSKLDNVDELDNIYYMLEHQNVPGLRELNSWVENTYLN